MRVYISYTIYFSKNIFVLIKLFFPVRRGAITHLVGSLIGSSALARGIGGGVSHDMKGPGFESCHLLFFINHQIAFYLSKSSFRLTWIGIV